MADVYVSPFVSNTRSQRKPSAKGSVEQVFVRGLRRTGRARDRLYIGVAERRTCRDENRREEAMGVEGEGVESVVSMNSRLSVYEPCVRHAQQGYEGGFRAPSS